MDVWSISTTSHIPTNWYYSPCLQAAFFFFTEIRNHVSIIVIFSFAALPFIPESPRYLVRNGSPEGAKGVLRQIYPGAPESFVNEGRNDCILNDNVNEINHLLY